MQNLVVNAIQYTERGLFWSAAGWPRTDCVLRWDTGIGISLPDQARVFKEFTRGSGGKGTGMGPGLSIVERACRHLDHPLKLTSRPGHGSMFSIEVPLAAAEYGGHGESPVTEASPEGSLPI